MCGPPPAIIFIHLGTNDLGVIDQFCIRQEIASSLQLCKDHYPSSIIVWSDILPRLFYFGARSQKAMERQRRYLNRWANSQCQRIGAHRQHHVQFKGQDYSLYRYDGIHLSNKGNQHFRSDILESIQSFV